MPGSRRAERPRAILGPALATGLVAVVLPIAASSPVEDPADPVRRFVTEALAGVGAVRTDCPAEAVADLDPDRAAACARVEERDPARFRRAWERVIHQAGRPPWTVEPTSEWQPDEALHARFYVLRYVPLVVMYAPDTGGLMVVYEKAGPCPDIWPPEGGLRTKGCVVDADPASAGDVVCPEAIENGPAIDCPDELRLGRRDVALDAWIRVGADGRVAGICIERADPEHRELLLGTIGSLRQNRYRAALVDGRAVPAYVRSSARLTDE